MDPLALAARRFAEPMVSPTSGLPLIKSTPSLGRMLQWESARVMDVPVEWTRERKRARLFAALDEFIKTMAKDAGHPRFEKKFYFEGPFPPFHAKPPDIQVGDRGGTRPVARSVERDTDWESDVEDWKVWALFNMPEGITEIPSDLAAELFAKGKPNLRPLREKEWRKVPDGFRTYRSRNA